MSWYSFYFIALQFIGQPIAGNGGSLDGFEGAHATEIDQEDAGRWRQPF